MLKSDSVEGEQVQKLTEVINLIEEILNDVAAISIGGDNADALVKYLKQVVETWAAGNEENIPADQLKTLDRIFSIFKTATRKNMDGCSVLFTEIFVDVCILLLSKGSVLAETKAGEECRTQCLSALNNAAIRAPGNGLYEMLLERPGFGGDASRLDQLIGTMRLRSSPAYLTIMANLLYRCMASNAVIFEHVVKEAPGGRCFLLEILVATLASCVWDGSKNRLPLPATRKKIDLASALFRIAYLYISSEKDKVADERNVSLKTSFGLILLKVFFLDDDVFQHSYQLKKDAVMVLTVMPKSYLSYFVSCRGVRPLCQHCVQVLECCMLNSCKTSLTEAESNLLIPLLVAMYKIAMESGAGRSEFESIIFPCVQDLPGRSIGDTNAVDRHQDASDGPTKPDTVYKPSNAPAFSFRYHLISLLLKTSNANVLIPLGDFLLALCNEDVDIFVGRVGLGYGAGVLQRKGSLAQIMSRQMHS
jgi:hypothetical protein